METVKKMNYIFSKFAKNGTVYIKQNENSMPVVIINMNVLHDMFPNFYDLSKAGNENHDILGDQSGSVLLSYEVSSGLLCCICGNVRGLSARSFTFSGDCMESLW